MQRATNHLQTPENLNNAAIDIYLQTRNTYAQVSQIVIKLST